MRRALNLTVEPERDVWSRSAQDCLPDFHHGQVVHLDGMIGPWSWELPCGGCTNYAPVEGTLLLRNRVWPEIVTQHLWPAPQFDWQKSRLRRDRAGTRIIVRVQRHDFVNVKPGPLIRRPLVLE